MLSLAPDCLDKVHCLRVQCAHPCCWESAQRAADGVPRLSTRARGQRNAESHGLVNAFSTETLPSLNIVNVSEWVGGRKHYENKRKTGNLDSPESEESLHSVPCLSEHQQKETTHRFERSDPFLPPLIPADSIPQSSDTKERGIKLNMAQISPPIGCESSWASHSVVLWVPNPHYVPTHRRLMSPQYTVTELFCLPGFPTQEARKTTDNSKRMKKRVLFHQAKSTFAAQTHLVMDGGPTREDKTACIVVPTVGHTLAATDPLAEACIKSKIFLPRKKPVVLHSVQEKRSRKGTKDASASLNTLDNKSCEKSIDCESLRSRQILPQHKECRSRSWGAGVVPQSSCMFPVPKVSSHHPNHSPLSVGPALWRCVKKRWRNDQCGLTIPQSTASESHTPRTVCNIPATNTDETEKEKVIKSSITPFNTEVFNQPSTQDHQGTKGERPVIHVALITPEEHTPTCMSRGNENMEVLNVEVQPWRLNVQSDSVSEPTGYQLSTPPPSLCSL